MRLSSVRQVYGLARFAFWVGLIGVLIAGCARVQPPASGEYWPTRGWRTSTPEEQGMDSERLAQMLEVIRQEPLLNLHSLLVIRHGYLVGEVYFTPSYGPNTKHVLYSVTKSFISTLVGIAFDKGILTDLRHPVLDFFPRRTIENRDARKEAMTLEDLLTMQSGLDWHENDSAYLGLMQNMDAVKYVLDEPMKEAPGTEFLYCSGCSHVLSGILQQQPGVQTLEFAKKNLLEPLGISDYRWDTDSQGVALGGWGLYLTPRDMAKLGYLYLHNGLWDGQQIVSAAWVKAATQTRTDPHHKLGFGYGYQWWTFPRLGAYMALGRDGQDIVVVPASDLVVVVTAEQGDLANDAVFKLIESYILTAVKTPGPLPPNSAGQAELAAQTKASNHLPPPSPLYPSVVHAAAEQWSVLLLAGFGLWALASKRIYLGREVTGWAARGAGLLALIVAVLQVTHHSTCNLLFTTNFVFDPSAQVLSLVAIFCGWQAGRATTTLPPAPRSSRAAWVALASGVAVGCLLGIVLQAPALFTMPTLQTWAQPLLIGLGLTVLVMALLRHTNRGSTIESPAAALIGGLLIGWLFGYLGQAVINLMGSAGASLATFARQGAAALSAVPAYLWPGGAVWETLNHWVVVLVIGYGLWLLVRRRLYLGGGRQITGWTAGGLGLLMLVVAVLLSTTGRLTDLGAYVLSGCFGENSAACTSPT